jgi:predicted esterase
MSVKIVKKIIKNNHFTFNAMAFLPSEPQSHGSWALFTHGYTSCKKDCLPWAQRLSEAGIPSVIFDLPGHYLGSFEEVENFEIFKNHAHECFIDAHLFLKDALLLQGLSTNCQRVILGGHSLGAMLSLKALELDYFQNFERIAIGVGLGIGQHKTVHLFESSFYEKTLNIRRQLVSPALDSDYVFPWIKQEKLDVNLKGERIHLITGVDDVVVGEGGMDALAFSLTSLGNQVTTYEPKKLPHHEPESAGTFIYSFLKKELSL